MKKEFKKVLSCVIAAGLTAVFFTGCGNNSSAAADSSIEFNSADATSTENSSADTVETADAVSTGENYEGALSGKTLSVGCDVSFVPFCYPDDTDTYVGFDIDLMDAMSKYLGFEYTLQPMEFTALLSSVQTKKLDLGTAGITIKPEREEVMDFSDPYYDAGLQILVKNDSDIKDFSDLSGKKLALKQGTAAVDFIEENYPDAQITEFPTSDEAYLEVSRGAADAAVFDSPNMLYYCQQNPDADCKVVGTLQDACQYGILFPSGSEYTKYFNAALAEFRKDGTYNDIYTKWFGAVPEE